MKKKFLIYTLIIAVILILTMLLPSCKDKDNTLDTKTVYSVEYVLNNESGKTLKYNVADGDKASEPNERFEYLGYVFSGWYEDAELTKQFDFETAIKGNKTLYASWKKQLFITWSCDVLDLEDFTIILEGQSVSQEKADSVVEEFNLGYYDYEFDGIYLDKDYKTKAEFPFVVSKNTKLFIKTTQHFEVSYNYNVDGVDNKKVNVEIGTKIEIPQNTLNPGYEFEGWYEDAEFNEKYDETDPVAGNLNLYAKWVKYATVKYDLNYEGANVFSTKVVVGTYIEIPSENPTREGYTFDGWYLDKKCEHALTSDRVVEGNVDIFASWKEAGQQGGDPQGGDPEQGDPQGGDPQQQDPDVDKKEKYTVTFDPNFEHNRPKTQTVYKNAKATEILFVRENFALEGWYTNSACTSRYEYDFNTPVTANITLFANWVFNGSVDNYKVFFDYGYGSKLVSVQKGKTVSQIPDPTMEEIVFDGWYADDECTVPFNFSAAINTDTIIYGKWENLVEVTYNFNDGRANKTVSQKYNHTITEQNPTRTGYTFDGWYLSTEFEAKFDVSTPITEPITLVAKWNPIEE